MADYLGPLIASIARYLLFAGAAYFIFYRWKRSRWLYLKIQQKFPEPKKISTEIRYSLFTAVFFGLVGSAIVWAQKAGYTLIYTDIAEYGWAYFWLSILMLILIHDTYFYWTHRMMHVPKLFPVFHRVHHLSTNPSPWAAFAFHPLEAVVEVGFFPVSVFILPLHPVAMFLFLLFMIIMNVAGHLGYELFPKGFTQHKVFRWYNTSTHHNMHHRFVKCNYGLYFNFWDRVMRTNHRDYDKVFDEVKSRAHSGAGERAAIPEAEL